MLRPITLFLFICYTNFCIGQTKVETLINTCQYPQAFQEIAKQPNSINNRYYKAILLMHFGALELSKTASYQVIQNSKDPILLAKTYQLLFDISYTLTDIEAEKNYADSSYYFYKKVFGNNSIYKAQYNINLCKYYNYFRRNDLSKELSIEALDICRRFKTNRFDIDLPMVYGQYYASFRNDEVRQNIDSAQIYCDSALYWHKLMYYGTENFSKIKLYHLKGLVYLDINTKMTTLGKWKEGKKYLELSKQNFEKANDIIMKNIGNKHVLLSLGNALIGLLYLQQKENATALKFLNSAEENLYPNAFTRYFVSAFTVNLMGIYDWQNNAQYSQFVDNGKPEYLKQALFTARKSEEIYQLLLQEGLSLNDFYSHIPYQKLSVLYYQYYNLTKEQKHLDSSYFFAEKEKVADLLIKKQISRSNNLPISVDIQKEKEYVDLEILMKNKYIGELASYKISKPIRPNQDVFKQIKSIKELQHGLKDDSTAIILFSHYNVPARFEPIVVAHIITKKEYKHHSFELLHSHAIKDTIDLLMQSLVANDLKLFKLASKYVYTALFEPIAPILPQNAKRLLICPINRYRNFPFEVLISDSDGSSFADQPYLMRKYAISYLISPSYTFAKTVIPPNHHVFVFNPDFAQSDKSELPFNKKCSQWLSRTFDKTTLPTNTNKQDLKNCLLDGNTIHLATHAVGFDDYTNEGRIYTSDTPLFLNDLYHMDLKQNPFVVLTCCEADKGNLQFNVGNDNFSRAFSFAGASAVLSTLWSIDDQASSELMKQFYQNLAAGMDKSTALQQAKLSILNDSTIETQAPFYWAANVLTGDISSIELNEKPDSFNWIILTIVLFSIALFFIVRKVLI
jgi:CHAT domain-containing protein